MYQGKFTIGNIYSYHSNSKGDKVYTYLGLSDQGRHRIKFTDDSYNEVHQTEGGLREVTKADLGKPTGVTRTVTVICGPSTTITAPVAPGKWSIAFAEPEKPKEEQRGFTGVFKPGAKYARVSSYAAEVTYVGSLGADHVVAYPNRATYVVTDATLRSTVTHEIVPKVDTVEYRNVYQNRADGRLYMSPSVSTTRPQADSIAAPDRVGCQKITLTKGHYDD